MTVKALIFKLRKMPQNSEVAWRDHDQNETEINKIVGDVSPFEPATSFDPKFCKNVHVVLS